MNCTYIEQRKEGIGIPKIEPGVIERMYGDVEWKDFSELKFSPCSTHYFVGKTRYNEYKIRKIYKESGTPSEQLILRYLTVPNGQVKNFMVAVRCANRLSGVVRVAVVGSKATERGGTWHRLFAYWLAGKCSKVVIDFFDPNERDEDWDTTIGTSEVSCRWYSKGVTPEQVSSYDCVISDVWSVENKIGWGTPQVPVYSLKGDHLMYQPFLHSHETRYFSSSPLEEVRTGCQCMLCAAIKDSVSTYEEYRMVRSLCTRLGHATPCVGTEFLEDLAKVHDTGSLIRAGVPFPIYAKGINRILASLGEELSFRITPDLIVLPSPAPPSFQPVSRFQAYDGEVKETYPFLEGKKVQFSGVSPSIIGRTNISREAQDPDVAFIRNLDIYAERLPPTVYSPLHSDVFCKRFPGWQPTGRSISIYFEYHKKEDRVATGSDLCPRIVVRDLDVYPRKRGVPVDGSLISIITEQGRMVVVPYDEQHKVCVRVDHKGTWTFEKRVCSKSIGGKPWDEITPLPYLQTHYRLSLRKGYHEGWKYFWSDMPVSPFPIGKIRYKGEIREVSLDFFAVCKAFGIVRFRTRKRLEVSDASCHEKIESGDIFE